MLEKLTANPKRLFLIDSLGAILTAFNLAVILAGFEEYFGMPVDVLYFLAGIACIFAVYSCICYYHFPNRWPPFLKAIAIANLLYCCLTMGFVIAYYLQLTALGVSYFLLELIIVVGLVSIELRTSNSNTQNYLET